MTIEEAKAVIYGNVVYACEKAGFSPCTTKLVQDACDMIIAMADRKTDDKAIEALSADRAQGEWIKRFGLINCSVCKHSNWSDSFEHTVRRFKFYPNCGARMKGGK